MKSGATLIIIWMILAITGSQAYCQKKIDLESPDKAIRFSFYLLKKSPAYSVAFKGKNIISDSEVSLSFQDGLFKNNVKPGKPVYREGEEKYELIVGKTKNVHDRFREVIIPMSETVSPFRQINLVVRAFNDGVAFRYEFREQKNWHSYLLLDEVTSFRIRGNPKVLALFLPGFTTSHEGYYSSLLLSDIKEDTLIDVPALFEFPDQTYLAITEAALVDYAGMYLSKRNGNLTSRLSTLPNQNVKVKADLPHRSPWRVLMISDRPGTFIESSILTSLNEPCKIKDTSWIKPGKTTWPWWNGNIVPDTTFAPGNNFETNKYYIDFCARNGLEYHSVVEYGLHEWYVSDGVNFQPGPNTDVTKPVPGLDMQQVCDYAKEKGVGIRLWVHWAALYPKLDEAFTLFEKWGVKGLMVDFMDRDDQEMINIQEEILQKAADHKLHIQFHGVQKPTGLSRTYPNEFTREGVMNYEYNKWGKVEPDHDINIPFTRMLAGPTDYHLGGFRAVSDSLFKTQYTRPLMLGTRCHMMAMYVVLENYLGMLSDYPEAYEGEPGFDFLKRVPTTWDETKVLQAKVGEYIALARRKGDEWFIGVITNSESRTLVLDLSFLSTGGYSAQVFSDDDHAKPDPNQVEIKAIEVTNRDKVSVALGSGGGSVIHLKRK